MSSQTTTPDVLALKGGAATAAGDSMFRRALTKLRRDRLTLIAMVILAVFVAMSIAAPFIGFQILKVDYARTNIEQAFLPPGSPGHVLGTDDLGRDLLARLLYAGQVSLGIAFLAGVLSMTIGIVLGIVTGFYGGIIDDLVTWVIATLSSIPSLFLLLIVAAVFSPGPTTLVLVLGLLGWLNTARLVRGETLGLREREFVVSARAIGASPWRIMFRHIAPNLFSVVAINLALDCASLILVESALSFLGLGIQPPTPSWGNMLTGAQTFFTKGPHMAIAPGLLISVTVLCLFIIGDGLRDAFDPTVAAK